ncbi:MAG: Asp-tRNA(Asn)/Glu-tRNA(Gln) amidotransferase GatCAB subunit C [Myxococcales bacterium]|jgi:aspartyl-tRNA(Asn)/glutamyl-tRNA(Gln) amidotransferase subunit C|nr:Asp-tRNA(Asn)/Glu-tRNA(Gln) amidotransferase GatCAB subunit C [Myxococcales bacterium]MBL0193816.1 Asp-tRNA(Asn)/Glu-tRNA(Gln) amidotransferase GatCAB subunit C [Myxococcales bacterium]HQY63918.1 aspartyl/glutamyl-tRNA amidotransferase subunit C [Polyangiaceae bacterium]
MKQAELLHLATLAGLTLEPTEEARIVADLSRVLAYMGELAAVDIGALEPLESPSEGGAPTRDDVARAPDAAFREAALGAAPEIAGGAFVVPAFLD